MAKKAVSTKTNSKKTDKVAEAAKGKKLMRLQKLSLFFFKRPRLTALIWITITVFGVASYATLLKREGFPAIETPLAISQGTYLVNDASKVDNDVAKPLNEFLTKQEKVKTVQTQSFNNFYVTTVLFEDSVNAETRSVELNKQITDQKLIPADATGELKPYLFGFTTRGDDLTIAFVSKNNALTTEELAEQATKAAAFIKSKNLSLVEDVSIINPFESAVNPATGQTETAQKLFDRFGVNENGTNKFYTSIVIGVNAKPGADNLEVDKQIQGAVDELNASKEFENFHAQISGSNAPSINQQITELQRTLLEGLLAILIVGSIVIAIRASIIIVLAMATVLLTVNGFLYLIDYSLNTITLFSLVLALSLIVDDTIIMTEAIDAERKRQKKPNEAIKVATRKISRAMVAATATAALSFTPLIFVGGILGKFIRAIPITIISALIISLIVALVIIPLLSRFLLLRPKQMGEGNVREISAGVEAGIARFISAPMLWAKNSRKKLFAVSLTAVFVGLGFIATGGFLMTKVDQNIFPAGKDTNQLYVVTTFAPGVNIEQAQATTNNVNKIISDELGANFVKADNYALADTKSASQIIDITDYKKRDVTAPQLIKQLEAKFVGFTEAQVTVATLDAGPPVTPLAVRIDSSQNREAATRLANDVGAYLKDVKLKRLDGSLAEVKSTTEANPSIYAREDDKSFIEISAIFKDTDTTALVNLAQDAVKKEFPKERVASYGLDENALGFSLGQEQENQDSFKTLALAFPVVLLVIYLVLALEFKSLLQPLLIFMAIPFSLFGITLGLWLTDNAFSFFAMLGFFALIGLSIKNTILLTDYANQARAAGMGAVDAAHEALAERFRPLIATSLTAVVSLIPLAISSPFWEGLCVVLIFGLLSSTFLVITVFPYYYLGAEFMKQKISRKIGLMWFIATIGISVVISASGNASAIPLAPILAIIGLIISRRLKLV